MEKMVWEKPEMNVVAFAANEYVAACWSVYCNVPSGIGYFETNNITGYQEKDEWVTDDNGKWYQIQEGDTYIDSGRGCGEYHEVSGIDAAGPKANAWWEPSNGKDDDAYEVFYFQANGGGTSNHHFAIIDDEHVNWDPNPNASN